MSDTTIDELRAEVEDLRRRVGELEGENAGLRQGYSEISVALHEAGAENARLRSVIAGIAAHGGQVNDAAARVDAIARRMLEG